jgi:hypothetical protein
VKYPRDILAVAMFAHQHDVPPPPMENRERKDPPVPESIDDRTARVVEILGVLCA